MIARLLPFFTALLLLLTITNRLQAQTFGDDFDREDGTVGNGWGTWNGSQLADGEVVTFGSDGFGGGIFRPLPVTFPLEFSFDFRTESPLPGCSAGHPGGSWIIALNAPAGGYAGAQYEIYQYHGAGPI